MGLGLGLRARLDRAVRRARRITRRPRGIVPVEKLHIGSGPLVRQGWINIDLEAFPGVDYVLDVREGLPFRDARYVFAEHFLEHLAYDDGLAFLRTCRSVLRDDGVLRLSTPNLDWVWSTHYRLPSDDPIRDCFALNKAFRGWGHQFLYNLRTLTETLHAAGFAEVRELGYGASDDPNLRDLERHETYDDEPGLPHVVVVEARGRGTAGRGEALLAPAEELRVAIRS